MQLKDLLVSNLSISEDNYIFKGTFTLSGGDKSVNVDLESLDNKADIARIREYFMLEESVDAVQKAIMEQVVKSAAVSSRIIEGENYEESSRENIIERLIKHLDIG